MICRKHNLVQETFVSKDGGGEKVPFHPPPSFQQKTLWNNGTNNQSHAVAERKFAFNRLNFLLNN